MKSLSIALLLFTSALSASEDKLLVSEGTITVASVFDTATFITTYSSTGESLWEAPFTSEVITFKRVEDHLLVFSKARSGMAYFLTCIDAGTGALLWEKPILSPNFGK